VFPGTRMRATHVIPAARGVAFKPHNCRGDALSRIRGRRKDRATPGQRRDRLMWRGRR
jgi:hypothetical protein